MGFFSLVCHVVRKTEIKLKNPQPWKGSVLSLGLRTETQQYSHIKIWFCFGFFIIADINDLVRTCMTFFPQK